MWARVHNHTVFSWPFTHCTIYVIVELNVNFWSIYLSEFFERRVRRLLWQTQIVGATSTGTVRRTSHKTLEKSQIHVSVFEIVRHMFLVKSTVGSVHYRLPFWKQKHHFFCKIKQYELKLSKLKLSLNFEIGKEIKKET